MQPLRAKLVKYLLPFLESLLQSHLVVSPIHPGHNICSGQAIGHLERVGGACQFPESEPDQVAPGSEPLQSCSTMGGLCLSHETFIKPTALPGIARKTQYLQTSNISGLPLK